MMDSTLFHAKKIVSLTKDGWHFEITILFEGREYALTDYPISIKSTDVPVLCPGVDPGSAETGQTYRDTIDISSREQFEWVFREALTDDATELLCDVYSGRSWTASILDSEGRVTRVSSLISDKFPEVLQSVLDRSAPCWISLSFSDTSLNEDWSLSFGESTTVFSNMYDGMPPLSANQVAEILRLYVSASLYLDREEFEGTITKQGNSLVLKVTDQCRRMGIDVGDSVNVVMDRSSPSENTRLRVFDCRRWMPISDPDDICQRDGCDLSLVRRFLEDFHVIGTVSSAGFTDAWIGFSTYYMIFDHASFFKTESGRNIIVSQPYKKSFTINSAKEWAHKNGCSVEEFPEYSWHHPPETTLLVFRKVENPYWKLPERAESIDAWRAAQTFSNGTTGP